MRTMLFKGRDVKTNKFVFGTFIREHCKYFIINDDKEDFEIFDNSLKQFTGISDIHKKMIFEDDMVRFEYCPDFTKNETFRKIGTVIWSDFKAAFVITDMSIIISFDDPSLDKIEIIN